MKSVLTGLSAILLAGATLVPGAMAQQGVTELEAVTVESESDDILVQDGYVAIQDRIGTKLDTPIAKIPQSITTITQDQIEDQKPRTLNEAVGYTASANPNTFGYDSRYDAFTLRGFPIYYNGMFRDGLRQFNGPSAWFKTEPYGIEGVTLLKGPASSLYGVSGPGGIVNLVTKRPKDEQFREIEILGGNNERYQAAFDFSGPATEDGALLYRLTGLARKSGTELPFYPDDKLYLAPAVTWRPDADTRLTVLAEVSQATTGGTAAFYNPSYGVASPLYEGDPAWNDFDSLQGRIGYEFERRINETVTLRQNFRANAVAADLQYSGQYSVGAGLPLARYWGHYQEDMQNLVVDTMAQFEFETGPVSHTAVTGVDYAFVDYEAFSALSYVSVGDIAAMPVPSIGGQRMNQFGLYAHDQMEWNDLTVFASGRYDWVDTDSIDGAGVAAATEDSAFSYRLGASYRTPVGLIPYASYSTSFAPNVGLVFDNPGDPADVGRAARPTVATQKEVGVKYEVPGMNAVVTAALFDIEQEDGVVFEVVGGINYQRQLDLRSRGFEIEANASLGNGFSVIASYTHLKMEIERGATGTVGNELSATPNDIFALWGHYRFEGGPLAGLGLGAGVRYVGESFGDDLNSIVNEDRVFLDAALSYDFGQANPKWQGLEMQVNAKNILGERKQTCSAGYCYFDEGTSVTGSLRYRF